MGNEFLEKLLTLVSRDRGNYAIPPLDGALKPNDDLEKFFVISDSLEKPDDIAISDTGELYVSTGKRVFRLSGGDYKEEAVFAEFDSPAGGLGFHSDGRLMVCVDGQGLVLCGSGGAQTWLKHAEGLPLRCPRAAVSGPDGSIYIADGSIDHNFEEWPYDLMEKRRSGRLIRWDPGSGKSEVLLSKLGHPHGLTITHDKQWLIITESWTNRILSYPLKNIRSAAQEVIIPNLSGYPARIVSSEGGGYWLCFFAMRTNMVEFVLMEDKFRRRMITEIENPDYWLAPVLCSGKNLLREPLQGGATRTLGVIKPWAPPRSYGLVIKLDETFEPVRSWHSRPGSERHGITGLREYRGEIYVVSKGHSLVLRGGQEEVRH